MRTSNAKKAKTTNQSGGSILFHDGSESVSSQREPILRCDWDGSEKMSHNQSGLNKETREATKEKKSVEVTGGEEREAPAQ